MGARNNKINIEFECVYKVSVWRGKVTAGFVTANTWPSCQLVSLLNKKTIEGNCDQ